ncbi:class I lanthipeptide [Larkinella punicea]|uniref:class I lanthipeptide n=1 Tax=Larkinella punicea TaxID=2315727 RepID=UPI00140378A6|nr:class I lanthipeptide [Larkinella punicea]
MKKKPSKLTLKTDQVVALSKSQAENIAGGRPQLISKDICGSNTPGCPVRV